MSRAMLFGVVAAGGAAAIWMARGRTRAGRGEPHQGTDPLGELRPEPITPDYSALYR